MRKQIQTWLLCLYAFTMLTGFHHHHHIGGTSGGGGCGGVPEPSSTESSHTSSSHGSASRWRLDGELVVLSDGGANAELMVSDAQLGTPIVGAEVLVNDLAVPEIAPGHYGGPMPAPAPGSTVELVVNGGWPVQLSGVMPASAEGVAVEGDRVTASLGADADGVIVRESSADGGSDEVTVPSPTADAGIDVVLPPMPARDEVEVDVVNRAVGLDADLGEVDLTDARAVSQVLLP
ncbi:MAG: hypothetical protein JST54_09760 [Deltaproteobacteria bacterium]|nr:hypothetical protein [Deltaproteobacteria bacterium]